MLRETCRAWRNCLSSSVFSLFIHSLSYDQYPLGSTIKMSNNNADIQDPHGMGQ